MPELCRANLERIRHLLDDLEAETPLLNRLLQSALDGQGEVLRISPHRTVLRIELAAGGSARPPVDAGAGVDAGASANEGLPKAWLVKISHPHRDWEFLRRVVSTPPALRELENWQLLKSRIGLDFPCDAQQLRPQLGLFVRPFFSGVRAKDALPARAQDLAEGLAQLHAVRWSDRDLDAGDLLYADDFEGQLIPLDLGQARVGALSPPPELIYRDLARLLSGLPFDQIEILAEPLLAAHQDSEMLHHWTRGRLIRRARRIRQRRSWERSARCWRDSSDFVGSSKQARRRSFMAPPPVTMDQAEILSSGPRSTTLRMGQACWKHYPRPGLGQGIRKSMGLGPARLAYRRLYWLELLGLPAARVMSWQMHANAEWLATRWIEGRALIDSDYPDLARYLALLHVHGISMRDCKPANFLVDSNQQLILVDGDGLRHHSMDRGRDLARLLAENDAGSPLDTQCLEAYQQSYAEHGGDGLVLPEPHRMQRLADSFRLRLRPNRTGNQA